MFSILLVKLLSVISVSYEPIPETVPYDRYIEDTELDELGNLIVECLLYQDRGSEFKLMSFNYLVRCTRKFPIRLFPDSSIINFYNDFSEYALVRQLMHGHRDINEVDWSDFHG